MYQQKATQLSILQRCKPKIEQNSEKIQVADANSDRLITRAKSTGDGTNDSEDVKVKSFSDYSEKSFASDYDEKNGGIQHLNQYCQN